MAKKKYKADTGTEMTVSKLKSEYNSMFPSKSTKQYIKDKEKFIKERMKHYGF